ncbi:MAG: hypothetical protein HQM09_17875, partial [Candidatus Riflebacteria bacterium]|nr:hypothetical protein [Candidatus Riflebacteria bacterium]
GNDPRKDLVAAKAGIPVFLLDTPLAVRVATKPKVSPQWTGDYKTLEHLLFPTASATR